jgi:hypothetical protein
MADPLTVLGGVASIAQIISCVVGTVESISAICHHLEDAPAEFYRMKQVLEIIQCSTLELKTCFSEESDDLVIPVELRRIFFNSINLVGQDVSILRKQIDLVLTDTRNIRSVRGRLRWALVQRRATQKSLECLKESENIFSLVLQHLNLYVPLPHHVPHVKNVALTAISRLLLFKYSNKPKSEKSRVKLPIEGRPSISETRSLVLGVDNWLRNMGVFGSYTYAAGADMWRRELKIGFNLPTWLWLKCVLVELRLMNPAPGVTGFRLQPSQICLQNRVPIESPFMVACRNGDVDLIQQHLRAGSGRVHDRTICTGQTPLLVSGRPTKKSFVCRTRLSTTFVACYRVTEPGITTNPPGQRS